MGNFVHLHLHTEYSLLDGCCRIRSLFDAVKSNGQTAVAITDHGVMYGAVNFYKEAIKNGVKPIIGCEVYVAPRSRTQKEKGFDSEYTHLVLLCENETGYKNLIKMVSLGFTEGFYSKPRIDKELLKQYNSGIIALSGCLAGAVSRPLLKGDYEAAKKEAIWYDEVFGRGNYYLELQDHNLMEQKRINPSIVKISKETGIPLVCTNDVHYVNKEDAKMQKVLICLQTGKKITDDNPLAFETDEFYLKHSNEMERIFAAVPEAVENTVKIADRCNYKFEFGQIKLPHFDIGDKDHTEYLKEKCYEGFERIYGDNPPDGAKARLDYEISVIDKMGYVDYYLIVWDFVNYAKQNSIPVGPGRGSGAGSLAAYCMGITGIDPIKYNLLFERFLNPERVSMPDFDIDFCYVNRQKVIDYVIEKYGSNRVAQIVTFGTIAARNAIRDVGRVMDYPYSLCDKVAKMIPREYHADLQSALDKVKELHTLYESDSTVKALIDMALKVEGMPRHASTHAAGVVISAGPVWEYVPLSKNDEAVVTQYTMTALDELGLLKMDFLGLRNLTVIADTEKEIRKTQKDFSVDKIPENDKETLIMMGKGHTEGVFQFESAGMVKVLRSFKPETLEDLIAILSLYRPGPMDSIPKYIHNRFHPRDVKYDTPLLKPILDITYGCIVYQEQVMQVCRALAGYSLGRADIVRRAMSKKKHEVMKAERQAFVYGEKDQNGNVVCTGAVARGVDEKVAHKIFDDMTAFSSYAFNKSHAAAYGYLAYQTAYLKCHYPAAYMASLITSVMDNSGKVIEYTNECQRLGIKILPPCVNESEENATVSGTSVRFGLLCVRNLGRSLVSRIIKERESGGRYRSLYDFCLRNISREFSKRALENLIKSGALDSLGNNRREMLFALDTVLAAAESKHRFESGGQMDLFGNLVAENNEPVINKMDEFEEKEKLAAEKEATGMYLTGHPMRQFYNYTVFTKASFLKSITSSEGLDGKKVTVICMMSDINLKQLKNGQTLCSVVLEDATDSISAICFSATFTQYRPFFTVGKVVKITAKVSEREEKDSELIIERVEELPEFAANFVLPKKRIQKELYIKVRSMDCSEMTDVTCLLTDSQGNTPVYIYDAFANKKYCASEKMWVDISDGVIKALKNILGEENVKIVEKEV